ncbi:uncharacterized protein LACBIDRAFT_312263 [Laccaria bicolor S238N-H82]|uniref:Predicted protein n=1 Tax=Laccaria bicolor (strain S238N-H82 / ATCC MYA-4686) TaxID=486041 RepID=B0DVU6_LACBS|nr:uncharacterized protein LACBIDRAFT_312263 [Laccaria bicolor S238N-H82]EDR01361.1 predicted protein [Laccaria bicolor S238N-H82]|eukprot:XP_001888068.1 predicted protein [Laccaria bicolor S238N-H82]
MKRRQRRTHIHPPLRVPRQNTGFGIPLQSNVAPMGREFKPLPPVHTGDPSRTDKNFNWGQSDEEGYTGGNEPANAYYANPGLFPGRYVLTLSPKVAFLSSFDVFWNKGTIPNQYNDDANPYACSDFYISLSSP